MILYADIFKSVFDLLLHPQGVVFIYNYTNLNVREDTQRDQLAN